MLPNVAYSAVFACVLCTVSPEITSGTLDRTCGPINALSLPTNPVIEGELVSFLQFRGGALYFSSPPLSREFTKIRGRTIARTFTLSTEHGGSVS